MNNNYVEQIAISRLIENAHEQFDNSLLSADGIGVIWGSFVDDEQLAQHYFQAKGIQHLTDKRRNLKSEDEDKRERIESAALCAFRYITWVRKKEMQPIRHSALVTYCAAFENCLKSIAVALLLAKNYNNALDKQIYVPSDELKFATKKIYKAFRDVDSDDFSRIQHFFEEYIQVRYLVKSEFFFQDLKSEAWTICNEAFLLRNAILHSMARPSQRIEIGNHKFHPNEEIIISSSDLDQVRRSLENILMPFWVL